MSDNVTIGSGATTPVDVPTATDLIGGAHYQRVKLTHGVDGAAVDASATDPLPITGAATISGTVPVSVAAAAEVDGHSANIGSLADASSALTLTGLLKAIKAAVTGTIAVSGTFWQATQPVSAASLPLPTGAAADATLTGGTQQTLIRGGSGSNAQVKGATTSPTASDPALVVAVSPNTMPIQAGTATLANVSGSASSVTLQASNTLRKGLVIVNDSTAILYVKFGSSATTTSYTYFLAGSTGGVPATLELPSIVYTGIVTGIWASATGAARMTELT